MVEQRTENPCVPGSIPGGTTITFFKNDNIDNAWQYYKSWVRQIILLFLLSNIVEHCRSNNKGFCFFIKRQYWQCLTIFLIVWATDNIACPIVDHCQYCRSKKLRINLLFKKSSVRIDVSFFSTFNSQPAFYSASVKSSCFFSRLACATLIFIGSPSWYLWWCRRPTRQ